MKAANLNRAKLNELAITTGYDDIEFMMEQLSGKSFIPGICINKDCDRVIYVKAYEHDGHCVHCGTDSVKSALVLYGIF